VATKCPKCQSENLDKAKFCSECGTPLLSAEGTSPSLTKTLQAPVKTLTKGSTFAGRYKIIEELGRGGMGVVYKAEDTKLKRTVALKFLPPELTHIPDVKDRFMREAQAAAALDHPNICTVYELDEAEEKTFISMAYMEGQSLRKKLESGPLELDEALRIALQAAQGLQMAHKKGVVHRDIKSANIMVSEDKQAKIMDFGLARMTGGTLITQEGTAMGTIAYMSPEQAQGEEVDHRTDIWSLGVVLYEMFGGRLPFMGEQDQAVVYSILNKKPKPITDLRSEIPVSIGQVVDKALEKNPDERYQQIDELLDDLKSISAGIMPEEIKARLRKAKLRRRKRIILYAGAAGFLIIATLVVLTLFTGSARAIDAIAVLPLENLTGDPQQEFFVDAATDELIGQLAQIAALRVISRRSVMQYKGAEKPLPEIAEELNVDALVEGTVSRVSDSVRIRVQLIEALPEERNLWAQTYERDMTDVLVMYKEMARTIIDKTRVKLTADEEAKLARTRQVNPEAYEAYIKGRSHWYKLTSQDLELALQYFELALEKDPDYALAYAGIAEVWIGFRVQGLAPSSEAWPKVKEAALRALELDDTLAEVQFMLALVDLGEWDWRDSEKAFQQALELNPNYPDARAYYSQLLFMMRRPEEAMVQIEQAMELDPFNTLLRSIYAWDLIYAHRYDDAIDHLRETLRTAPDDWTALSTLRSAYHQKRMYEEALEIWKRSYEARDDQEAEDALVRGYEEGGYSGALSSVAELLIERSRTTFVTPWQIGTLYTRAGKKDKALEWLEKAFEARDGNLIYLSVDPIFDYLRSDPRFQDLLRKMNLPVEEK
jgi:TolB-like protein/tetratricopeptide (TPR) repeat protein/predicted Ser/Thr protein kinase